MMRQQLRAGAWNLKVGRPDRQVLAEVRDLLKREDLDVLAVHEAAGYLRALGSIEGYRYITGWHRDRSGRDAGLLVRRGLRVRRRRILRTVTTWRRVKYEGRHLPRSFPSAVVEGIRIVSVHMPDTRAAARSRLAYAECVLRLLAHLSGRHPFAALGDWNKRPGLYGPFTPRALAEALRARITGAGIDYAITRGLRITDHRRGPKRGSDHAPVLCTLERDQEAGR